jgi:Glyoxalase-like domain
VLEIDHIFCMVPDDGPWRAALTNAGFLLDGGTVHGDQGTRNQRVAFAQRYLELVWLSSRADATANPLRFDVRADWRTTGASPFGIGLRGSLGAEERAQFWPYEVPNSGGFQILVHQDNTTHPERPFLFVIEVEGPALERMRDRISGAGSARTWSEVYLAGSSLSPLMHAVAPTVVHAPGDAPHLRIVLDGGRSPLAIEDLITLVV